MIVTLKTVQNQVLTIQGMNENDNISVLKRRIADENGYALDGLKIVFDGEILKDDNKTLAEVGVKEDNFVVILGRKEKKKPAAKAEEPAPVAQQAAPVSSSSSSQPQAQPQPQVPVQEAPKPAPVPQPQPAPVQQPQQHAPAQLPFGITQSELEGMIANLMEMGFEKTEVEKCLRAAYYSPERAIDYLTGGIPAHLRSIAEGMPTMPSPQRQIPQMQPQASPQPAPVSSPQQAAPATVPAPAPVQPQAAPATGPNSQLAGLFRQIPNFEQMRAAVQQDPRLLRPILTTIASRNPELYAQITQNTQEFIQLLTQPQPGAQPAPAAQQQPAGMPGMPIIPGMQGMPAERPGTIIISQQEKQAIDNLVNMGFDRVMAAQAYLTFKDENLAANFLLENQDFAMAGGQGAGMEGFEGEMEEGEMEEMEGEEGEQGEQGDQALYEEDFDDEMLPPVAPPAQPQQPQQQSQPQQPPTQSQPQSQPQQPPKPEEKKDEEKKMDEDKQ